MAQTVNIQGVGDVQFPDDFTNDQITHAIETDILPSLNKSQTTEGGAATGVFPQMTGKRALQDKERSANMPAAIGESALAGAMSIPAALAEYAGFRKPAQMVQEVKQHAADISYPAVSSLGSTLGEGLTVGPVAGKAFQLAGKVPALGGSTLFKSGVGGLTAGALTPTEGTGDFAPEKGMQVLGSTAVGGLTGKLGQMMTNPTVSDDIKKLIDMGMTKFTPAQLMSQIPVIGPALREAEKKATSVPLLGDIVAGGIKTSFGDFNKAIANKALEPLGIKVPSNVKAGAETNQFINQEIQNAYNTVRDNTVFNTKKYDSFGRDVAQRMEDAMKFHSPLLESDAKEFKKNINGDIIKTMRDAKMLGGDAFREMEEKLGQLTTEGYQKNPTLGKAYENMLLALRNELGYQSPAMRDYLTKTHEVFKNMKVLEDASARRGNVDAIYSPQQFGSAVQAKAGKAQTAQGMGRFVDEANAGSNVLGNTVPDSGTAGRSMIGQAILGAGSMTPVLGPLALKALVGSAAYSPAGMKVLTNLATKRPEVFKQAAPYVTGGLSALGGMNAASPDLQPEQP